MQFTKPVRLRDRVSRAQHDHDGDGRRSHRRGDRRGAGGLAPHPARPDLRPPTGRAEPTRRATDGAERGSGQCRVPRRTTVGPTTVWSGWLRRSAAAARRRHRGR